MKTFTILLASAFTFASRVVFAQEDPGPSPTASFGCEPHGDHWHCEGAITSSVSLPSGTAFPTNVVVTTTSAAHDDHDHEHNDEEGTGSLGPSPTESVGCEPHGDRYHCEGPRTTSSMLTSVAANRTVIVGTTSSVTVTTGGGSGPTVVPANGASGLKVGLGAVVLAVAAGFAL
ncbi:hypothetical protein CJF32_00011137 [Rutstroemia sp. NJR-2017a WRK4]|nr:hypothetical protein CJF32_00011137 [Rutstroemia sp. NJR-2017a WRK4]